MLEGMGYPSQITMVDDIGGGNGDSSTSYDTPVTLVDAHVQTEEVMLASKDKEDGDDGNAPCAIYACHDLCLCSSML